jgi:protein-S-isoprenylcysteine O-methyltransferase Ste14
LRAVQFFIDTPLIYLAPPLLGWGLDDLAGFFSLSPRLGYAVLVVLLGLVAGYQAMDGLEGLKGGKGKVDKLVRRQSIVKVAIIFLMYVFLAVVPFADRRGLGVMFEGVALRWPGLVLAGTGFALIFWSGFALGRFYSADVTVQKDHRLITTGLYQHIRHPRYLGGILFAAGFSVLFRSWIGLVGSALFVGVILFRIKDEEALMRNEFGQEWQAYCQQSWRLMPYLY